MNYLDNILKSDPKAEVRVLKKGAIVQRCGEVTSNSFFVKSGLLKSYIIDEGGKEHIFHFASENWIIGDIESQEFEHPAELYIDCIEDSEVVVFDRNCTVKAELTSKLMADEIKLLSRRIGMMQRRILMLMSSSASVRYAYFLKTYPELSNRIPQHMIASYLGVTPQALSTIRRKLAKSN